MGDFFNDLKRGKTAEQLLVQLLTDAGLPSRADKQARQQWDVISDFGKDEITTEVKYDEYENRSGNVAIEVYNPRLGKPSGVTATEAFFWAHVLVDGVAWITPVSKLKKYVDKHAPERIIDRGGDNNACLWLYKSLDILPDAFHRADTMTPDELLAFVLYHWNTKDE